MAPFTKRPAQGAQQLVRCWVEVAGAYDGEDHEAGEWVYLDERQAHVLQRQRRVRVATYEEAATVERADQLIAARSGALPGLSYGMGL